MPTYNRMRPGKVTGYAYTGMDSGTKATKNYNKAPGGMNMKKKMKHNPMSY